MPLKDKRNGRNFEGKTLSEIFSSGKSIQHHDLNMEQFAEKSEMKFAHTQRVSRSYWCGINKGSCRSQCGCSGGGRVRDHMDKKPTTMRSGLPAWNAPEAARLSVLSAVSLMVNVSEGEPACTLMVWAFLSHSTLLAAYTCSFVWL